MELSFASPVCGWDLWCIAFRCADATPSHRKLVIIGDGACGKTSLLSVFTLGYFPTVSTVDNPHNEMMTDQALFNRSIMSVHRHPPRNSMSDFMFARYQQCLKTTWQIVELTAAQSNWHCGTRQDKKIMSAWGHWHTRKPMSCWLDFQWILQIHWRMWNIRSVWEKFKGGTVVLICGIVDWWGKRAMPRRADPFGWVEEGSSWRSNGDWRNAEEVSQVRDNKRRHRYCNANSGPQISWMLLPDRRRCGWCLWSGYPCCPSLIWKAEKFMLYSYLMWFEACNM